MQEGIIIQNISNLYYIQYKEKCYQASARGKLKKEEITPVVGDKVIFEVVEEEKKQAIITKVQERQVFIKRPKLANLTQLILVVSAKMPKPDFLLLDKQLAFAEFLGLKVGIVWNKVDLEEEELQQEIKIYEQIGYPVIRTNAKTVQGLQQLEELLKQEISAFSGNSGVGKSTLINQLLKKKVSIEGEISYRNERGKNTTTAVCMYSLGEKTYLADTPRICYF